MSDTNLQTTGEDLGRNLKKILVCEKIELRKWVI